MPGLDNQGAVFTISHGTLKAVWLVAERDLDARHFQYVYFIPGVMVTTIDVCFLIVDPGMTRASITYARTAVSPEGDLHVKAMSGGDEKAGGEWQSAIDVYLREKTVSAN